MEADGLRNVILVKKDGNVETTKLTEEKVQEIRLNERHLCFDCGNMNNCEKVLDARKATIDNYDFIDTGKQVIDGNGRVQEFVVLDCKDFVFDNERKITGAESVNARRSLLTNYFGAEDYDEAKKMLEDLERKNSYADVKRGR